MTKYLMSCFLTDYFSKTKPTTGKQYFCCNNIFEELGKGQNVENQNVESLKKNIESQKEHQRSERQKSN